MKKIIFVAISSLLLLACANNKKLLNESAHKEWVYQLILRADRERFRYIEFLGFRLTNHTANTFDNNPYAKCEHKLYRYLGYGTTVENRVSVISKLLSLKNIKDADTLYLMESEEKFFFWKNGMNPEDTVVYLRDPDAQFNHLFENFRQWTVDFKVRNEKGFSYETSGFYEWVSISEKQPCRNVFDDSTLYYYTIFVRDEKEKLGFRCIKAILFEN
jgi:hypothetical protein